MRLAQTDNYRSPEQMHEIKVNIRAISKGIYFIELHN
jgi:hypothetical protein